MGSPMSMGGGQTAGWNGHNPSQPTFPESNFQEPGLQLRPMGLKVHYTFDKESKINCLARIPQTLQVQTVPIDETTTIGVLDLRICIQAVIDCSPELASEDCDYTIYALDYSEPDTPLVGQGMLSWALETLGVDMVMREPKLVTGRVTKNLLGVFGGGNRETLEVKLKLTSATRVQRNDGSRGMDLQQNRPMESAGTPTAMTPNAEWNSFIHNNPQIGQRGASPALSHMSHGMPPMTQQIQHPQDGQRVVPKPVGPQSAPAGPSRPSSRTSNPAPRKSKATGRPRGRPRKRPLEGNTSGYEDGTEGEEGPAPAKKRVATTMVEKMNSNPFGAGPESLRVAAGTSGSIRTFRPVRSAHELAGVGNHLQDVPRAPTPIPDGSFLGMPGRGPNMAKMRRDSTMSQDLSQTFPSQHAEPRFTPFSQEDSRSPESAAPTPMYSEDSPVEIGSSPPVAKATSYVRSSPPPSSPILPPMPQGMLQDDLDFANTEMEELFAEEAFQAAMRETLPSYAATKKPLETTDVTGVPTQVFRLDMSHIRNCNTAQPTSTSAGPDNQHMMHMRNYNTPHPTSTPIDPMESSSLPPLPPPPAPEQRPDRPKSKRASTSKAKGTTTSPPTLAPTPPPTTDAVERPNTPRAAPQFSKEATDLIVMTQTTQIQPARDVSVTVDPNQCQRPATEVAAKPSNAKRPRAKRNPRQLNRSQSAGALTLSAVPASEPVGPSSLSHATTAEPASESSVIPPSLKRSASTGPLIRPASSNCPVPFFPPLLPKPTSEMDAMPGLVSTSAAISGPSGSDIPLPMQMPACPPSDSAAMSAPTNFGLVLPQPVFPPSDILPPPSSPTGSRPSKNVVKKNAIKQRLEAAIAKGEMPPFCNNCGAIETPTWRRIYIQEHDGIPPDVQFSEKPGEITAIEVLRCDEENVPLSYRLTKKSLDANDDIADFMERVLCNPCGIWLTKCKSHRPEDRWPGSGLNQARRKRSSKPRVRKRKGDSQILPTSEAYLHTDALGPVEPSSFADFGSQQFEEDVQQGRESEARETTAGRDESIDATRPSSKSSGGGQASRTVKSPVDVELDETLGSTKRLLFPSPRKEGMPMILGELSVNIVQTTTEYQQQKVVTQEKENLDLVSRAHVTDEYDELEDLFRSPAVARPCTPPPKAAPASAFKTPTRPTPSHRPITRSVSRSMRSNRSLKSPICFGLDLESPSQSAHSKAGSAKARRSPRNQDHNAEMGNGDLPENDRYELNPIGTYHEGSVSPITRAILDLIEGDNPSPSKAVKPREDILTTEEMETLGWYNMFRSPEKNDALQKALNAERFPDPAPNPWYTGRSDGMNASKHS